MKDVPSLEEVAYMLHNNIDAGRIIKLYSEGLSISEIIETKDISEAHAVALYS